MRFHQLLRMVRWGLILISVTVSISLSLLSYAQFMDTSNPLRKVEALPVVTNPRYHNFKVLDYLNDQPTAKVLSFAPAWIFSHTTARVVNYMDSDVLLLFDDSRVKSIDDLREELQHLGITHIHKDNYFTWPMIYRTPFLELLSNSRYAIPVVMGNGGNLFKVLREHDPSDETVVCAQSEVRTYKRNELLLRQLLKLLFTLVSGAQNRLAESREFSIGEYLITAPLSSSSDLAILNLRQEVPNSQSTAFITVDAVIYGSGIAVGMIEEFNPYTLETVSMFAFAESRDEGGIIRLLGQVPASNQDIRVRFSTTNRTSDTRFELASLVICTQANS